MRQHFRDAGTLVTAPFRVSDHQGANPSLPLRQFCSIFAFELRYFFSSDQSHSHIPMLLASRQKKASLKNKSLPKYIRNKPIPPSPPK